MYAYFGRPPPATLIFVCRFWRIAPGKFGGYKAIIGKLYGNFFLIYIIRVEHGISLSRFWSGCAPFEVFWVYRGGAYSDTVTLGWEGVEHTE